MTTEHAYVYNLNISHHSRERVRADQGQAANMLRVQPRIHGFTMIEVLVVVLVLSILIAAAVYGTLLSVTKSRDMEREADMTALSSLLETHYDTNGRYPVLSEIAAGGLKNAPADILTPPGGSGATDLISTQTPSATQYGYMTYDANTTQCNSGAGCAQRYKLYWRDERSGTIREKTSAR